MHRVEDIVRANRETQDCLVQAEKRLRQQASLIEAQAAETWTGPVTGLPNQPDSPSSSNGDVPSYAGTRSPSASCCWSATDSPR